MDMRPLGVILDGGLGSRMGFADKGLMLLRGRPLLAHVIERLAPQVAGLAINANGEAARLSAFGLPVIADSLPDHPGPLAGVLAGMDWAADLGARSIVTVAADTPFFPADLVARLQACAGASGLCLAASRQPDAPPSRHPTIGMWPVALRENLRAALRGGMRKVGQWADAQGTTLALFEAVDGDPFFNINTPEDLHAAQIRANAP